MLRVGIVAVAFGLLNCPVLIDTGGAKDQVPLPEVGVFAAKVAVLPQTPKLGPALAVVGFLKKVTFTVSVIGAQTPFVTDHWKI
jgi:hypothetical protein